jgi:hypothetical protein
MNATLYYVTDGSRVIKTFFTYREAAEYLDVLRVDLMPVDRDERQQIAAALEDPTEERVTQ